jgi:glutamate racemase
MAAYLYPGVKSLHLVLDKPYDTVRTTDIRDDLQSVRVWYSTTTGFDPNNGQGTLVPSGNSLSVIITNLVPNTRYYVKYAFISAIDSDEVDPAGPTGPESYTVSSELTQVVYDENVTVYGYLTNDPTGIATAADGTGGNFSLATGTFKVYDVSQDVTGAGPVYSIKANSNSFLTGATIDANSGVYSCTGMTANSGSITFLATYKTVVVEQVWNVYKGIAGANAPLIQLSATNSDFVFKDQFATTSLTTNTVLTAALKNITGTVVFTAKAYTRAGVLVTTPGNLTGAVAFTTSGNTITITGAQFAALGVTVGTVIVTATIGTVSDSFTLYRINDGTEQITVELSNSSHLIPAAENGDTVAANYIGSGTTVRVKQGNTYLPVDQTSPYDSVGTWNIFDITSVGITCDPTPTVASNYIDFDTHAAMTADSAYIDYTIYYRTTTGQTGSQVVRQSFAKSKAGITGSSAPLVTLTSTGQVFIKQKNTGTVTPSSVTLTATASNFGASPTYVWKSSTDGGATLTVIEGATGNTLTRSSFAAGTVLIRVDVTGDGETGYDLLTLYSVKEGDDTIVAGLENENQTVSCDSTGTPIAGQLPLSSKLVVLRGSAVLTNSDGVTWEKASETGMTSTINATTGVIAISAISAVSASATYNAKLGTLTLSKILTLNKSNSGAPGANAPLIQLSVTNSDFVFKDEFATTPVTANTVITAALKNITGTPTFTATAYTRAGALVTSAGNTTGAVAFTQATNTITITGAQFAALGVTVGTVIVTATIGTVTDSFTLYRINDGTEQITVELSNSSHLIPATESGSTVSANYTGSGTTIRVKQGNTLLTVDATSPYANGTWYVSSTSASGITADTSPTLSASTIDYDTHSAMTADNAYIDYTITYITTTGQAGTQTVRQSFAKSKAGIAAPLIQLSATNSDFVFKDQFATTPVTANTVITAALKNITGTPTFTATAYTRTGVLVTSAGNTTGAVTFTQATNTITITGAQFAALGVTVGTVIVTATIGTVTDSFTLYRINDGTEQITVELSNSAHVIPAANDGTVATSGYTGSGTTIRVKQGNTLLTVDAASPYANGTWYVSSTSASGITADTSPTLSASTIDYDTHSAMTADIAYIDYTISYVTTTGQTGTQIVRQSFAKSKAGATGASTTGGTGAKGISTRVAYKLVAQNLGAPAYSTTTTGNTSVPTSGASVWTDTAPTATIGNVVWYSYGRYNEDDASAPEGIALNTTKWSAPIAASIFQDIRSDNWQYINQSQTVSTGVPDLQSFLNIYSNSTGAVQAGYYIKKDTGDFYGTNVYMQGQVVAKGQTNTVTVNWTNDKGIALLEQTYKARSALLGYAQGGVSALNPALYPIPANDPEKNVLRVGLAGYAPDLTLYSAWNVGVFAVAEGAGNNDPQADPSTWQYPGNRKGIGLIAVGDAVCLYASAPVASCTAVVAKSYGGISQAGTFEGNVTITRKLNVNAGIDVIGDIVTTGAISATGNIIAYNSSDRRLKQNILRITKPLQKLRALGGYNYDWTPDYLSKYQKEVKLGLIKAHDVGVIAQEVLEQLPEAVHTRQDGTLAVSYEKLIPLLIEAILELDRKTR